MKSDDLSESLRKLADQWCERKALVSLHSFLPGYFAFMGLNEFTDGPEALESALREVLRFAKSEITTAERKEVKRVLDLVQDVIFMR